MTDALSIWTVYKHPKDRPDKYVARRFEVDAAGPRPTADLIATDTLEQVRMAMMDLHLVCLMRNEEDDPVIIESWL